MMIVKYPFLSAVSAITFDDYNTLRYDSAGGSREDIVYPIFRALRKFGIEVEVKDFLSEYFKADKAYRKNLRETYHESLLDNIIKNVLTSLGYRSRRLQLIVGQAVDEALITYTRPPYTVWYPDALPVLRTLRKRGYKLGLISNTHWRILDETKKEFEKYFDVITLSYEHGYAKPHPSIFHVTLRKLEVTAACCLHVGDDPFADVQGAKSVGMRTAFIRRGRRKAKADIQIERLIELIELL